MRQVLQHMLTRAGYTVALAEDGNVGLAYQAAQPADVLIVDLIMPNKEGMETIGELLQRWPTARIIAISGGLRGGSCDMLPVAKVLGAMCTLSKPFTSDRMLAAIGDVLARPAPSRKTGWRTA